MDKCEHQNMSIITIPDFAYQLEGVGNFSITDARVVKCADCASVMLIGAEVEKWHEEIAQALCETPEPLKSGAVIFLRKRLELDQAAFARLLHVDQSTVSRWETGRASIPGTAQALLKEIYRVKTGERRSFIKSAAPSRGTLERLSEKTRISESDSRDVEKDYQPRVVQIPEELEELQKEIGLTYWEARTLLEAQLAIRSRRSSKSRAVLAKEDWRKLYRGLKPFLEEKR